MINGLDGKPPVPDEARQNESGRRLFLAGAAIAACGSLSQFFHWQYPPPLKFGGSLEEFRVESLEVDLGLGLAEVASAPIPGYGRTGIAPYTTQAAEAEKGRVERLS